MRLKPFATIVMLLAFSPWAMAAGMSGMAHMEQMETHLKKMDAEMQAINRIMDPKEKRARMQQHLKEMTRMMHNMNENMPTMSSQEQGLHMQMLEKRLDLLQQMMTQVVDAQAASFGFIGPEPTD